MKKFIAGMICGATLMLTTSVFADGAYDQITAYLDHSIKVEIDGKKVELANTPVNYDGSTYLPVRELAGAVGLTVDWDEASRTAKLSSGVTHVPTASVQPKPAESGKPVKVDGINTVEIDNNVYLDLHELVMNILYPRYDFSFNEKTKTYDFVKKSGESSDAYTILLSGIPYRVYDGSSYIDQKIPK